VTATDASPEIPAAAPLAWLDWARLWQGPLGPVTAAQVVDVSAMPRVLGRILGLAGHYPRALALALGAAVGSTLFNLALPRLLGQAVDQAHGLLRAGADHGAEAAQALALTAGLLIGASALRGLLQMASGFYGEWVAQKVGHELRLAFFEKLQRLDFAFHDRSHSGDLITRGMLDLDGMRAFIENGLQRVVSLSLLLVFGSTLLLLGCDPLMALLAFSFVPFVAWRAVRSGLLLRLTWTRLQEQMSLLTRVMEENLQGMRVVRAFSARAFELIKFDQAGNAALRFANHRIFLRSASISLMNGAFHLSMAAVLLVGGHRVQEGLMTVGQLTEVLSFMMLLQLPVRQINMIVNTSARATSSGTRLFQILDQQPAVREAEHPVRLCPSVGVLRFDRVRFAYPAGAGTLAEGPPVLDEISFELAPGQTLGIVGPPGAGKSTLAHLVPRYYDVTGGAITIDGIDIRDLPLATLRQLVGVVQQDVFLFDDTVAANVAYAEPAADHQRLVSASATAQLHGFLAGLPEDYRTRIGERGVTLSGGQRQRLAIARSLVPEPRILVFDDATSAVDAATEHRLRHALQQATRSRAVVIISHRLGSLMHADEILVLDHGRIVERGRHEQLLARGGHYHALYQLQTSQLQTNASGGLPA